MKVAELGISNSRSGTDLMEFVTTMAFNGAPMIESRRGHHRFFDMVRLHLLVTQVRLVLDFAKTDLHQLKRTCVSQNGFAPFYFAHPSAPRRQPAYQQAAPAGTTSAWRYIRDVIQCIRRGNVFTMNTLLRAERPTRSQVLPRRCRAWRHSLSWQQECLLMPPTTRKPASLWSKETVLKNLISRRRPRNN